MNRRAHAITWVSLVALVMLSVSGCDTCNEGATFASAWMTQADGSVLVAWNGRVSGSPTCSP